MTPLDRTLAGFRAELAQRAAKLPVEPISCKIGCTACCHYPLTISILEGLTLYSYLFKKRLWTDLIRNACVEHSKRTWDLHPLVWLLAKLPCPLLVSDRCLGYQARPLSCRARVSKSLPHYCAPQSGGNIAEMFELHPEVKDLWEYEQRLLAKQKTQRFGLSVSKALLTAEKLVSKHETLRNYAYLFLGND